MMFMNRDRITFTSEPCGEKSKNNKSRLFNASYVGGEIKYSAYFIAQRHGIRMFDPQTGIYSYVPAIPPASDRIVFWQTE